MPGVPVRKHCLMWSPHPPGASKTRNRLTGVGEARSAPNRRRTHRSRWVLSGVSDGRRVRPIAAGKDDLIFDGSVRQPAGD